MHEATLVLVIIYLESCLSLGDSTTMRDLVSSKFIVFVRESPKYVPQ